MLYSENSSSNMYVILAKTNNIYDQAYTCNINNVDLKTFAVNFSK